jgi:ABC-type glycerol-3-phosphate transport system substrate-binding protein
VTSTAFLLYNHVGVFKSAAKIGPNEVAALAVAPKPLMSNTGATPSVPVAGSPLGISATSKEKELAWEVLKFHFRPDMSRDLADILNGLPPVRSALNQDFLNERPWLFGFIDHLSQYGRPLWAFTHPQYSMVLTHLKAAIDALPLAEKPPQELFDTAARLWNACLEDAR